MKFPAKDKWELPAAIPLMQIVRVNHSLPILHLSKIMIHVYSIENTIHQFAISNMINPSLLINNVFRTQVPKFLGCSFSIKTKKTIRYCMLKNNISVMELIMIYETVGIDIRKMYRVLSYVIYALIDN